MFDERFIIFMSGTVGEGEVQRHIGVLQTPMRGNMLRNHSILIDDDDNRHNEEEPGRRKAQR